ncbi:MAG TPA: flavin-dependent oxidoreductase, partial [Polyangiales bacterium]|nr:flavin-dependent oxidoreductase [Polyangiales bacterium]
GVGINLLPHAAKELSELGLLAELSALGIETSTLSYYSKHGQLIWQEPRGLSAGYPWPQLSLHRGALQMLLLSAVQQRLGPQAVQCGLRAESFEHSTRGARVMLRARDGAPQQHEVDVLIAADGIRSTLRSQLYPEARDPLHYSGRVLWRGATECAPFADGRSMFMAGHQDQKFVAYPISGAAHARGRSLVNWIAELRVPEAPANDWNRRVDKAVFAGAFADWSWGWIDIPALIAQTDDVYEFPLVDKDPLPRWTFGHFSLLGDAAHPLYPIGSNGSAQAILDARCLADCLHDARDINYALREYEAERLPKTAAIALRNRLNGPEQVLQIVEERAPDGFASVTDVISQRELEEISLRYKQLAGFDVRALQAMARA